jgi:hypothetical protein
VSWCAKNSSKRYSGLRPLSVSHTRPSTTVPASTSIGRRDVVIDQTHEAQLVGVGFDNGQMLHGVHGHLG